MEKQTSSFKVTILLLGMDLNSNLTLQKQQMRYLDLWILPDNNPEIPENSTCNNKSSMSNSNPYNSFILTVINSQINAMIYYCLFQVMNLILFCLMKSFLKLKLCLYAHL